MSKQISETIKSLLSTTKDDTVRSVLFNLRFIPTFSLIIDSTYAPIHDFMVGENPTLSEDAITGIIIAGVCQFIFKSYDRHKETQQLRDYLEENGLTQKVPKVKSYVVKLIKISGDVLKDMGYSAGSVSGILGFATILQPFMVGLNELLGRSSDFSIDNIFNYIVLGTTFKGALFLEQFLKNFTSKYEKDVDPSSFEETDDSDLIDGWPDSFEYGERVYEFVRITKDKKFVYANTSWKDDKMVFKTKEEFTNIMSDYTSPVGGTKSTNLGENFLSGKGIFELMTKSLI